MSSSASSIKAELMAKSERIKTGVAGGLAGGFSVLIIVFAIDSQIGTVPGTFYKVVGLPVGLDGISASLFGLVAHMATAALIGTVFCYCSGIHPKLELTSTKKGILAGGVSSIVVYLVFFIPITLLVVQPAIASGIQSESGMIATLSNIESLGLSKNMNLIIWGALEIHIIFGIILGIFCSMSLNESRRLLHGNKKMVKTVTVGVILGTIALAAYYVSESEFSTQKKQDELALQLKEIREDLNYVKFISMSEDEQSSLIASMPDETRELIINYAKNFDSEISEDMSMITQSLESPDELRYIKTAKLQGLKGNEVNGMAKLLSDGKQEYLRLEDFFVTNGIGLHVYITKSGDINSGYDLGSLKANMGDQNYKIPDINTEEYRIVVIYSKPFDIYYASANL